MSEQTIKLTVEGMSCNHCVGRVQKALEALNGVQKVKVDLEGKSAEVSFDSETVDQQAIEEVITAQGYAVR